MDDTDMYQRAGGQGYEAYGIDTKKGAIVVVRPDGYVGTLAPVDGVDVLAGYFSFMKTVA